MKLEPAYWAEPTGKFAAIPAHARMDVDLPIYTVPLYAIPKGYKVVPVEMSDEAARYVAHVLAECGYYGAIDILTDMAKTAHKAMIEGEQ